MRFCAERRAALDPNERSKAGFKMHCNNFTDKGTATTRRPASWLDRRSLGSRTAARVSASPRSSASHMTRRVCKSSAPAEAQTSLRLRRRPGIVRASAKQFAARLRVVVGVAGRVAPGSYWLRGLTEFEYCTSKARRAASIVPPIPTMPSCKVEPRSATQLRPRIMIRGRRAADGLRG